MLRFLTALGLWSLVVPGAEVDWMAGDRPIGSHQLIQNLIAADVVLVGEQHDDGPSHRTELALLKALDEATERPIVLSLEMFERDTATVIARYLHDELSEATFLEQARAWPNYQTDYRPLIQYARGHGLEVLAANVPRRIAALVAQQGLGALDSLPEADRAFYAKPETCPRGRPWEKFQAVMQEHPHGDPWHQYEAQCLKDATMAQSIGQLLDQRHPGVLIYHVQGAFHGEERFGVPWYLALSHPQMEARVVGLVPADGGLERQALAKLGDFVGLVRGQ